MRISKEGPRGCGYRNPGGLYLVSDGAGEVCSKLPIRLEVCPCCGQGIKPNRSWTWLEPNGLIKPEAHGDDFHSAHCPLSTGVDRCGLIWIGGQYYPTPASFIDEAKRMGISRRIVAVPRGFEVGDYVFLAHREADWDPCPDCGDSQHPGKEVLTTGTKMLPRIEHVDCPTCKGKAKLPVQAIFYVFRPDRIEYVVTGKESKKKLGGLLKRGIEPVEVVRLGEQEELPE
jgi:hypothetical protein